MILPFPQRRYSVIYADPPWDWRGGGPKKPPYPVMSDAAIKAMPVQSLAMPDCALFLWSTMTRLPVAFDVLASWGFVYKTVAFTWVKPKQLSPGWHNGMGWCTRQNAELCLLGMRGRVARLDRAVHSVVCAPIGRHSAKPTEVRARIERLYAGPRIELFARDRPDGWDVWGLDVVPFDDIAMLTAIDVHRNASGA